MLDETRETFDMEAVPGRGQHLPSTPDPSRNNPEGGPHLPTMPDPTQDPERGQQLPADPDPNPTKKPPHIDDPLPSGVNDVGDEGELFA